MATTVQTQIADARAKARMLHNELENVKTQIKDTTLQQCGTNLNKIPWGVCDLKLYNTLKGHQNKIAKFVWNSKSTKILSSSQDGYMIIWDVVSGLKKELIPLDNPWVLTCAFSKDEKLIASGGLDNACTIYRLHSNQNITTEENGYSMFSTNHHSVLSVFKGHTAYISDCRFLSSTKLITSSGDMSCALWDINTGGKVSSFNDHLGDVLTMDVMDTDDPNLFISGSSDGYVNLWDVRQSLPAQNIFITNNDVSSIKVFNGGKSFVSGSDDGIVRLIDLRSDCELNYYNLVNDDNFQNKNVMPHSRNSIMSTSSYDTPAVMSVDISRSYRLIYACYSDYGCVIWDSVKNEVIGTLGSHNTKVNQVSVSSDGLSVATAKWDSSMSIWSV